MSAAAQPPEARTYPTTLRAAWLPLAALCLAFLVEMADGTILTVALPTIGRDLHANTTALQWVNSAYSLTFGGLLLTAGTIADRFGRRRVLLWGLAAFGVISLFTAAVTSAGQLVLVRALLGVAAAGMAPITNSLLFRLFDDDALRMRAIGIMVIVGMSGFALGPILGGTALASVSWHWLLLVNAPIALFAWIGVRFGVAPDRAEDRNASPVDFVGAGLTIVAIACAAYSLTSAVDHGWTSGITIAVVAVAAVAAALFVGYESRSKHPMLEIALLKHRTVRGASLAQIGGSVAMSGAMFALILQYQNAYGWSAARAGFATLPFALTTLFGTPLAEGSVARLGHRGACLLAGGLVVAGMLELAWTVDHGYVLLTIGVVLMTLGLRIIMTACAVGLIGAMPQDRTSVGAALNDTAQELGSSLGFAVAGSVLASALGAATSAAWSPDVVAQFHHGERQAFILLAAISGAFALYGASTLTDSRDTEEH